MAVPASHRQRSPDPDGRGEALPAPRPLGLYIHIPFCEKKCPYCDFNTYAGLGALFDPTVEALCRELATWGSRLSQPVVDTVFLGGGTPTVLEPHHLEQIFATLHRWFTPSPTWEITAEANPGTVDREKFRLLRQLGVNRLSMGAQSLQPHELRFLGRIHGPQDVYRAFEAARAAGFDNINLDFMFGLPEQRPADWRQTLTAALALQPEHLSLYSLIVEPNTPLYRWVEQGHTPAPDEDQAAQMFEMAMEIMAAAGYLQYEISNWARAGTEHGALGTPTLACRHNLIYWRNQEYIGIGPGSHSHLRHQGPDRNQEVRWANHTSVPGYIRRIQGGESPRAFSEALSPRTAMGESMMMGLRLLREGVSYERFRRHHGVSMQEIFGAEIAQLAAWGLLEVGEAEVRLTARGALLGNQVFLRFVEE